MAIRGRNPELTRRDVVRFAIVGGAAALLAACGGAAAPTAAPAKPAEPTTAPASGAAPTKPAAAGAASTPAPAAAGSTGGKAVELEVWAHGDVLVDWMSDAMKNF